MWDKWPKFYRIGLVMILLAWFALWIYFMVPLSLSMSGRVDAGDYLLGFLADLAVFAGKLGVLLGGTWLCCKGAGWLSTRHLAISRGLARQS